jgi:hypothetical protein
VRTGPTVIGPHAFALTRGGALRGVIAARLEETDLVTRLAAGRCLRTRTRMLTVPAGGAVGACTQEEWALLVDALRASLREGVAPVASLLGVPLRSPFARVLAARVPAFRRCETGAASVHWALDLPEDGDVLARVSKKSRRKLRHYLEVGERTCEVRRTRAAAEVASLCARIEPVSRSRYATFAHDARTEQRMADAAERGWLRAWELVTDGAVAAYIVGRVHEGVFFPDSLAHDRRFARLEPGTVLLLRALRELAAEGVRRVDWGFGDYPYKRRFGATSWEERHFFVFAETARGAWLAMTHGALARARQAVKTWRRPRAEPALTAAAEPA